MKLLQKWIRNVLVVLVSVVTFGIVTPAFAYDEQVLEDKGSKRDVIESINSLVFNTVDEEIDIETEAENTIITVTEDHVSNLVKDGQTQVLKKFGPRIGEVLADEFEEMILPQMEEAIRQVTLQFDDDQLAFLTVTENPGKGLSEKIFHLRNTLTNEDIIRFHVRRDHPPQQGYWFNFHYHTYHDDFETHYELGNLYWAKNTPPKWMS